MHLFSRRREQPVSGEVIQPKFLAPQHSAIHRWIEVRTGGVTNNIVFCSGSGQELSNIERDPTGFPVFGSCNHCHRAYVKDSQGADVRPVSPHRGVLKETYL